MKFDTLKIHHFRNLENIEIDLNNKNVIFGMNDVGKTNFLYALRFLFDNSVRYYNFVDSDYFQKKTDKPIEITIHIKFDSEKDSTPIVTDDDEQKLRAKLGGVLSSNATGVYIQCRGEFNPTEMFGEAKLFWGESLDSLEEIKYNGKKTVLDDIFNVIYINSYTDLQSFFKKNIRKFLKSIDFSKDDATSLASIKKCFKELNERISKIPSVKEFSNTINQSFQEYKNHDDINISLKSEVSVNNLYSQLVPYIKVGNDEELYPTGGDGRKKLLVYALYNMLLNEARERKINLLLIEEPENHLHRSLQKKLSTILFENNLYKYFFMTTHSSVILSEMDQVNLIRISNKDRLIGRSTFYKVPDRYSNNRKILNQRLSEAIFADKVLLVEGPSEEVLFGKILRELNKDYEAEGIYILPVNGIDFIRYVTILHKLKISFVVKTDNDIQKQRESREEKNQKTEDDKKKYNLLGFIRLNKLLEFLNKEDRLPCVNEYTPKRIKQNKSRVALRLYRTNRNLLQKIRGESNLYLSHCSLEEDLFEVIPEPMKRYLEKKDPVSYLKRHKLINMVELACKLTEKDCREIVQHENFECLKEFIKERK